MVFALADMVRHETGTFAMKTYFWSWMGAVACLGSTAAHAQDSNTWTPSTTIELAAPAGYRLGEWLTREHPALAANMFSPGMVWLSETEKSRQAEERKRLIQDWGTLTPVSPETASDWDALKNLLLAMPMKGRKSLPLQDPWLMQLHSGLDPVLDSGDAVVLTGRPNRVRVIDTAARSCDVAFQAARWAIEYLQACGADVADVVWLIQPDGQVTRLGIGPWNAQTQEAPAPGAWLWTPPAGLSDNLSQRIARVMASQGVAQGASKPEELALQARSTPRSQLVSANDWGMTGLLQTPTARTPRAGHVGITASRVWPYTHTTLSLSPFDSVELGMRYTNISNQLYGPTIAGDQAYKDKSSEIKWRLIEETAWRPAVALGLRDPGGTGLFAGEYLVASKRWSDLDWSLGLGWGYLGSRGNLSNPLRVLGERFATRQNALTGSGGTAHLTTLFTGRTALFGGVQWHTPITGLALKLELDGNHYQNEPFQNNVGGARHPVNWGLSWQKGPLNLSVGHERGRQWMFGLTLSTDVSQMARAKSSEPAPWPVNPPAIQTQAVSSHNAMAPSTSPVQSHNISAATLAAIAAQTGWRVQGLYQQAHTWVIELDDTQGFSLPERIDRGMAVVHALAPGHIREVHFVLMQHGVAISSRHMDRTAWADRRYAWRGQAATHDSQPAPVAPAKTVGTLASKPSASAGLGYQQHLGGPDGYLYALNATVEGQWPLWPGAWAQGTLKARLVDNYDNYRYTAPSNLPRVRTLVREYLTSERITVPIAQVNQLNQWGDGFYSLAYAGALESMFAGVGAEAMWRPLGSRWAIGADVNRLAQRDFDQRLSLRDYRVNSGHITAYWDAGWHGLEGKLMIGQYLAGDRGATLEVSRRFLNGARMGAWVTKTNVSSTAFGEGSFDKGVFISLPFDAFLTAWSTQRVHLAWQPLIRDGGARLNRSQTLWNLTHSRDEREWSGQTSPVQR